MPVGRTVLLIPQWQGFSADDRPARGARAIASSLEVPVHELPVADWYPVRAEDAEGGSVLGLSDIAGHADAALRWLDEVAPIRLLTIGGDCGSDLAPIAWQAARRGGALGVLYLDAHADLNTPASSPSGRFHGMVLRTVLGQGAGALVEHCRRPVAVDQIVMAGTRALDPPEREFLASAGIVPWASDAIADGRVLAAVCGHRATAWHIHFDLDVLDPDDFPDVTVPTPGGATLAAVTELLAGLVRERDVVGITVTEHVGGEASARRVADAIASLAWPAA